MGDGQDGAGLAVIAVWLVLGALALWISYRVGFVRGGCHAVERMTDRTEAVMNTVYEAGKFDGFMRGTHCREVLFGSVSTTPVQGSGQSKDKSLN
jgi:hypothetical protein